MNPVVEQEATPTADEQPGLRRLAPELRGLAAGLRAWLGEKHAYPLAPDKADTLCALAADLDRQAEALDVDQPLLVVMLMGGTGVGKSTLLNALAGGAIAEASFVRPTTRDPVVYYHDSIHPDRLDPALRRCRLAVHDRPALRQKVLVDTPDIDSNDLANRQKLTELLDVADVVLYVGSQEKYHDQLAWDLFRRQRQRHAFAFVLNKWDRCLHGGGGVRPDQDLLADLKGEGFEAPLLFRTCAQAWVDRSKNGAAAPLPEGEQFPELVRWLEEGLTQLEIEAVKARGVGQLLAQLEQTLADVCPPDLEEVAGRTRSAWIALLADEAEATANILLNTLEPYQREIEHHFAVEGHQRFRGIMAGYLRLFTKTKYLGSTLRDRLPLLPRVSRSADARPSWDLSTFTQACSGVAGDQHLDARGRALPNRLLLEADREGFPLALLTAPAESAAGLNWRGQYARMLAEVLQEVEREWTEPEGLRRWVQNVVIFLADWLPPLAFLGACIRLLWRFFMMEAKLELFDVALPFVILLLVLVVLHFVVVLVLPLRWPSIRGEFRRRLEKRIRAELESVYGALPADVAGRLRTERQQVQQLEGRVRSLTALLDGRDRSGAIAGLYGRPE